MNPSAPYYGNSRTEMRAFLPDRYRRVLEIGCGEGTFRQNLELPNEYWGVELVPEAALRAQDRLDRVLTGTFEANFEQIPDAHFDLVICNDVIEHMPDHDAFLQAIVTKMAPGGHLMGSVPNVRYLPNLLGLLVDRDWAYGDEGVLDRTHLRFFTSTSLQRSFDASPLELDAIRGINDSYRRGGRSARMKDWLWRQLLGADTAYLQIAFRARLPLFGA